MAYCCYRDRPETSSATSSNLALAGEDSIEKDGIRNPVPDNKTGIEVELPGNYAHFECSIRGIQPS